MLYQKESEEKTRSLFANISYSQNLPLKYKLTKSLKRSFMNVARINKALNCQKLRNFPRILFRRRKSYIVLFMNEYIKITFREARWLKVKGARETLYQIKHIKSASVI